MDENWRPPWEPKPRMRKGRQLGPPRQVRSDEEVSERKRHARDLQAESAERRRHSRPHRDPDWMAAAQEKARQENIAAGMPEEYAPLPTSFSQQCPNEKCGYYMKTGPHAGERPGRQVEYEDAETLYSYEEGRPKFGPYGNTNPHSVGHGICQECYDREMAEYRAERARRAARDLPSPDTGESGDGA